MLYDSKVRPDTERLVAQVARSDEYDSLLGDRLRCRGTYREFVIFDAAQVYPEYMLLYRRFYNPDRFSAVD